MGQVIKGINLVLKRYSISLILELIQLSYVFVLYIGFVNTVVHFINLLRFDQFLNISSQI